jgi:acyl-CoA synthetase (AMP-forming)/AMP-acid ligase II
MGVERFWNFADVWEGISRRFPDAIAQIYGPRSYTWSEFDQRAAGVATALLEGGLGHQDKVAQMMYNGPEYLESLFACFKAGLVPVNTNYRYTEDELFYLWDNADTRAVVFHGSLVDRCEAVRGRLPGIRRWLWVDDQSGACPDWAEPYEQAATCGRCPEGAERSGKDLYLLYTGGTTGAPKGVMWPQHELFLMLESLSGRSKILADIDVDRYMQSVAKPGPRVLPAAPLMHGTSAWYSMSVLSQAGCVVTLSSRSYDPVVILDTLAMHRVNGMAIVGDAFAKPLVATLEEHPGRWDLSRMRVVFSSGVMFGAGVKAALLRHLPRAVVIDGLGSSESGSIGRNSTDLSSSTETAAFKMTPDTRVIDEDGRDVVPGSGQRGRLAVGGHIPLGYYKDPEKTEATFVTLGDRRYVVAGDWAEVAGDGTIKLLGRGSVCINTGGEKVYPEEVEEALKLYEGVEDAAVVGLPDDRFGEAIAALVTVSSPVDESAVTAFVKTKLAGYKAPRRVFVVPSLSRGPSGKLDYPSLRDLARQLASNQEDSRHDVVA